MTDSKKPSPSKKPNQKPEEPGNESYAAVGIVFSVVGLAMLINESMRAAGIPFVILGLTFFALSQQGKSKTKK